MVTVKTLSLHSLCARTCVRLFSCMLSISARSSPVKLGTHFPVVQTRDSGPQRRQIAESGTHRGSQDSRQAHRTSGLGLLGDSVAWQSWGQLVAPIFQAVESLHCPELGQQNPLLGEDWEGTEIRARRCHVWVES